MKKLFPYILIVFIAVQMLMPFTVGVGVKNKLEVRNNKAEAADTVYYYFLSTKNVEPDIGTQAWSNSFADVVDASGNITTSGKDLCEAAKTPEAMADLANKGYSAGPCTIVPKEQLGPGGSVTPPKDTSDLPVCMKGITPQIGGCIAQGMYYLFFKPTSFIFGLSGKALDFTLKYSLDDTSYRSSFVVEGWGLVRDFCNMFFIFILLYIAFGTILNLHSVKTKEMIINVVIIGLLINFSLFATQVIIDTSNILARVFYNQQTIVTGSTKDANGNVVSQLGDFGEIQLSTAIVSKVNPVSLITNAQEVNTIPTASIQGESQATTNKGITTSSFIIIVILATFVNVVGTIAFISCALVFIGRVLMLWLAMILAPLSFFSYTVPALQNIKMIGWKHWWPDTLTMAFVAPVFAFFMYIIVGFLGKGLDVINASLTKGYHGLSFVIAMIVPFAFIMILLMKAKSIAVSMSGEVGAAMSKAGAAVGGLALGAATGGVAMLGRASIGKMGDKLDKSTWVNKLAGGNNLFSKFAGNKLKDIGQGVSKSSFDVRATKLGGMAGKGMEIDMGKAKEGGYTKDRKDKVERKQKRAKETEVNENEELNQEVNKEEMNLQVMLNAVAGDFERIDKDLVTLRQQKNDATDLVEKQRISDLITDKLREKSDIKSADGAHATGIAAAAAAAATAAAAAAGTPAYTALAETARNIQAASRAANASIALGGRSIKQRESEDIPNAKNAKLTESRRRTTNYANNTTWWGGRANKEAQHKIIMETKLDSGTKT